MEAFREDTPEKAPTDILIPRGRVGIGERQTAFHTNENRGAAQKPDEFKWRAGLRDEKTDERRFARNMEFHTENCPFWTKRGPEVRA